MSSLKKCSLFTVVLVTCRGGGYDGPLQVKSDTVQWVTLHRSRPCDFLCGCVASAFVVVRCSCSEWVGCLGLSSLTHTYSVQRGPCIPLLIEIIITANGKIHVWLYKVKSGSLKISLRYKTVGGMFERHLHPQRLCSWLRSRSEGITCTF